MKNKLQSNNLYLEKKNNNTYRQPIQRFIRKSASFIINIKKKIKLKNINKIKKLKIVLFI